MSLHESDLKSRLMRFLGRKRMPRHLDGKEGAQADEIAALVAVLARNAPRGTEALGAWWPHFEGALGEMCGANWPTEREVVDASRRSRDSAPKLAVVRDETDMSPAGIAARQMVRGEPVAVGWLWGIGACELAARGMVDEQTMRRYQSSQFISLKLVYGEEKAMAWEAEQMSKHEAAKDVWRQRKDDRRNRDVQIPDISAPIPEGFAA